jgi:hypothetical protein
MLKGRRLSSLKLYDTYLRRWRNFCSERFLDCLHSNVTTGLAYLQSLVALGLGFSAINTARSAISSVILLPTGQHFGVHNDVKLFMKGVFNSRPPRARYVSTWDPTVVLEFLKSWGPAQDIPLDKHTMKLVMLIMLTTGQRPQILTKLLLHNMKTGDDFYEFALSALDLNQGRPNYRPDSILLKRYPENMRICVFHYLQVYLRRTALLRKDIVNIFITTTKPYRTASANTISRWLKVVLREAGVDTSHFSAGSSRAATTSKAKAIGMPIDQILKAGGWSNASTFTRFYDRPVQATSFAHSMLSLASPEDI